MEGLNITLPRMQPILELCEETGLTYGCLRRLCLAGKVKFIRAGGPRGKILVNTESLANYLNNENTAG